MGTVRDMARRLLGLHRSALRSLPAVRKLAADTAIRSSRLATMERTRDDARQGSGRYEQLGFGQRDRKLIS